jgi:hypothetical protein
MRHPARAKKGEVSPNGEPSSSITGSDTTRACPVSVHGQSGCTEQLIDRIRRLLTFEAMAASETSCTTAVEYGAPMIVMAMIGGVIVAGLAWAGVG